MKNYHHEWRSTNDLELSMSTTLIKIKKTSTKVENLFDQEIANKNAS